MVCSVVVFVRAKMTGIYIYSCYALPNATIAEFEQTLGMLVLDEGHVGVRIGLETTIRGLSMYLRHA